MIKKSEKTVKKDSVIHENRIKQELNGKLVAGSGSIRHSQMSPDSQGFDIRIGKNYAIEHKMTEKESISIKKEWISKIEQLAFSENRTPTIIITFAEEGQPPKDYALIPLKTFKKFINE